MDGFRTDDIFKTSHGVGHHWRPGFYFPSHDEKQNMANSLTRDLDVQSEINSKVHFTTTNQYFHGFKNNCEPLKQDSLHKKAPALHNVKYLTDARFASNRRPWKRSLSPRNQLTETQEEFQAQKVVSEPSDILGIKNFLLNEYDTHEFNNMQQTKNIEDKWEGGNVPVVGAELLRHLDPYLTTTQDVHRLWKPEELKGYPKKDILTFWETKEFPKPWGFGLKDNPLPEDSVKRQNLPMQDVLRFPAHTQIYRTPPAAATVPHGGMKSLYTESFDGTSSALAKAASVCPVEKPYVLPDAGTKAPMTAPLMYKTEYNVLGDCHRTLL